MLDKKKLVEKVFVHSIKVFFFFFLSSPLYGYEGWKLVPTHKANQPTSAYNTFCKSQKFSIAHTRKKKLWKQIYSKHQPFVIKTEFSENWELTHQ